MIQSQLFGNGVKNVAGLIAAATLMSSLAAAGLSVSAGAAVARYQVETAQYTVTVAGAYTHSYTVTVDPCNGSFTATGQYPALPASPSVYRA